MWLHVKLWVQFFLVLYNLLPPQTFSQYYFELKFPTISVSDYRLKLCEKAHSEPGLSIHISFSLLTFFVNKHAVFIYSNFMNYFLINGYYWAYLELINFMSMFVRKDEFSHFPIFTLQNYLTFLLTFMMEQYLISVLLTWENIHEGKCTLRKLTQCIIGYILLS